MTGDLYDVIIIGGGPIGLVCAIEAKKKNLNYLVLEKETLVNSLYRFPTNMTFFSTSKLLEIGEVPFISHSDKPTRREALEYYRRVYESWKLNVHFFEEVKDVSSGKENEFFVKTSKSEYKCRNVVFATGFYDNPRMLGIPGEELKKVSHYYEEPHVYVGQKLVVIGAANSACDVALETYHKGAEVTMVIRKPKLYEKVKYWIKPNIENRIKEGNIKAFFNSKVIEIKETYIKIQTPEGIIEYPNDFVLAMTGYKPDHKLLQNLGIEYSDVQNLIPKIDESSLECTVQGVFVAGVFKAGLNTSSLFIENTRHHGELIMKSILKNTSIS